MDPHLHGRPSSGRVWGEKETWGSTAHCGDQGSVSTMAWTPLLLVFLSLCTGRDGPQAPGLSPQPASALGAQTWDPLLQVLPHLPCVCVCRFPLPACADSVSLPVCVSGSISQTLLHHEQWLQHWQLAYNLVPAEARESSPVPPVLQLRLPKAPGLQGSQPLLWIQRRLGSSAGLLSSLGCSRRTRLTITVL